MSGRWIACFKCKHPIWMSDEEETMLRRSGAGWHCLWGHPQIFKPGKTDAEIAREERDEAIRQRDLERQRAARRAEERDAALRREAAAKGQVTKLKNRAAAGVCPCCNRTFVQLARHMKTKHPTFKAGEVMQ